MHDIKFGEEDSVRFISRSTVTRWLSGNVADILKSFLQECFLLHWKDLLLNERMSRTQSVITENEEPLTKLFHNVKVRTNQRPSFNT